MSNLTTIPSARALSPSMAGLSLEPKSPTSSLEPVVYVRRDTFARFVEFEGRKEVCELV